MDAGSAVREIVLPETEPETEWILDRPVQKVSPTRRRAVLQGAVRPWPHSRAHERGQGLVLSLADLFAELDVPQRIPGLKP